MLDSIKPYAKAIVGATVAGLAYLQPVVDDGVTVSEGIGAAIAFLTGLALVFAIPNGDPKAEHQDESVQPPEGRTRQRIPVEDVPHEPVV